MVSFSIMSRPVVPKALSVNGLLSLPDAGDIALLYAFAVHHREHAGDLVELLSKCHRFTSLDYTD